MSVDVKRQSPRDSLRGWVALWALATTATALFVASACSSSFSSCAESRTCTPREDGSGGAADAAISASGAGAGAVAGAPNQAGLGGHAELRIVSTAPTDAANGVERDAVIEVSFSAVIDDASITDKTFTLAGPSGPVEGDLNVDGETVTFTPAAPLALFADYTLDLSAAIAAVDSSELGVAHHVAFRTRDGVFRKPERLTTLKGVNLQVTGNRAGWVAVHFSDGGNPASSYAILFDPATQAWGKVTGLESDSGNDYSFTSLALNENGEAFAITGNLVAAWNRAMAGKWGSASTTGIAETRSCALADDGTAMTVWTELVGSESRLFAASLSADGEWSATATLQQKSRTWGVARFGSGFLVLQAREPSTEVFSQVFDRNGGWRSAEPITPSGVGANYVSLSTAAQTALFTWNDPNGRMQASVLDGTSWSSEDLGPVAGGTSSAVAPNGALATWIYQKTAYAARHDAKAGWTDPVKLGATTAEDFGPGAAIDDAGNALAVWPDGGAVTWRRSSHHSLVWLDPEQIKDQDPGVIFSSGDAMGDVVVVWDNPLGVWASRFE
jgi:hypothetical protein